MSIAESWEKVLADPEGPFADDLVYRIGLQVMKDEGALEELLAMAPESLEEFKRKSGRTELAGLSKANERFLAQYHRRCSYVR